MSKPELIIMGVGVLAFLAGLFLAWLQRRCKHRYFVVRIIHEDGQKNRKAKRVLSCSKCGKIKYE
jgi:hypothetical protein